MFLSVSLYSSLVNSLFVAYVVIQRGNGVMRIWRVAMFHSTYMGLNIYRERAQLPWQSRCPNRGLLRADTLRGLRQLMKGK